MQEIIIQSSQGDYNIFFSELNSIHKMWLDCPKCTGLMIYTSLQIYHEVINKDLHNRAWTKNHRGTMLQKLSKCEVKAWLCQNLIILLPLQFCVKYSFGEVKQSKNVIFGDSGVWISVNLGLESCSNLLKSKSRTSKIVKINIFGMLDFPKMWFHVKLEWC